MKSLPHMLAFVVVALFGHTFTPSASACSSHNAMWETNHLLMFQASLEWLTKGTVNGLEQGVVRLGY